MSDRDIHLKLDRILVSLAEARQEIAGQDLAIMTLTSGLSALADDLATQREVLAKLAEAMSKETEGYEMRELIARIQASLAQLVDDSGRMVTTLYELPRQVSDAAIDGVRMALGDGVDVHPSQASE